MTPGDRRSRPPLPWPLGAALEPAYRAVIARRNRAFDAGGRVVRLDRPVISIGNLSVGGTGKTPMVMQVVEWLLEAGHRPAIAMRGYRAVPGAPSDEQAEYLARFPGLPVVAQPDRAAGLAPLFASRLADCAVLDDGFQHRRIARNLDVVLIDASRETPADRCLPAGWLREPRSSLTRAGAVVLTHCESASMGAVQALESQARAQAPHALIVRARHDWRAVTIDGRDEPVSHLRGRPTLVACGIGNPGAFVAAAEATGARVVGRLIFPDHHRWTAKDVVRAEEMARSAADAQDAAVPQPPLLLTTGKDWVKIKVFHVEHPPHPPVIWGRPSLALSFGGPDDSLRSLVLGAAASPAG